MIRVNLLGLPKARKRARAPVVTMEGSRSLILLVVVAVLVAGIQFYRYRSLQAENVRLGEEIQRLTAEKANLDRIKVEYETFSKRKELLTKRISIIEGLKAAQTGPVRLLNMLATTVANTDQLWLVAFEQIGRKVTIEGIAMNPKAVADFLTRLKSSRSFAEMDLKETLQDVNTKDMTIFTFTLNGELAAPASAGTAPGAA